MIGQFGIIVLSFADTMMIGRHSVDELAAASFVNNMFNLVIIFATGFSYGLTPVIGRLSGRKEDEQAGCVLRNALAVNSMMALVLIAVMAVLLCNIHRLGQPEELLPLMRPYFLTLLASLVFVLPFNAFKQFADGITDTLTPMCILLGGNVFNIIFNWFLIYGKAGFPEMGLLGAGLATLSARALMFLIFIILFFNSSSYRPYLQGFTRGRCNRKDAGELVRLGMPVGLQMGMETASFSLSTVMVGWLGTIALAAHQVMLTAGQLGFMLYYGMAAAVSIRISHFHGRDNWAEVRGTAKTGFHIILLMAMTVSVFMLIFRHKIGYLFSDSAEVASAVATIVIPFVIYQFGDGMQCNYSNALRGISDVKMVTLYAFISYFVVSLPSGWLLAFPLGLGLTGIWLSFPLGLTCAGLLFRSRFRRSSSPCHPD